MLSQNWKIYGKKRAERLYLQSMSLTKKQKFDIESFDLVDDQLKKL